MFYNLFSLLYFIFTGIDLIIIILFSFCWALLPICISKLLMHKLFKKICRSFINFLRIDCHIHQKYSGKLPDRYILISNHSSGSDILILNSIFTVYPLAQDGVRKWFFLGRIAQATGVVFVKRERKSSRNKVKKQLIEYTKNGKNLLIYPEGGCFGKHLRDFKYGACDISIASDLPILPVYLQYEAENDFEWGETGLPKHLFNLLTAYNKRANCYIFQPIYPTNFSDSQSFTKYIHKHYQEWEAKYRLN